MKIFFEYGFLLYNGKTLDQNSKKFLLGIDISHKYVIMVEKSKTTALATEKNKYEKVLDIPHMIWYNECNEVRNGGL